MTVSAEKKTTRASDYEDFISSLELYTIGLAGASCNIDREAYWEMEQEHSNSYEVVTRVTKIAETYFDARSTLTLDVSGEKSKSKLIEIVASFDLHFHASIKSKQCIERFCDSDVLLIVMPYIREYVTDVTARMHVPPIILPLSQKKK